MADPAVPQGLTRAYASHTTVNPLKKDQKLLEKGDRNDFGLFSRKMDKYLEAQARQEKRNEQANKALRDEQVRFKEQHSKEQAQYLEDHKEQQALLRTAEELEKKAGKKSFGDTKVGDAIGAKGSGQTAAKALLGPLAGIVDPLTAVLGSVKERNLKKAEILRKKAEALQASKDKAREKYQSEESKADYEDYGADFEHKRAQRLAREAEKKKRQQEKPSPSAPKSKGGEGGVVSYSPDIFDSPGGALGYGGAPMSFESLADVGVYGTGLDYSGLLKVDVIKKFDPGSALIADTLNRQAEEDEEEGSKKKGLLGGILDGLMDGLGKSLGGGVDAVKKALSSKVGQRLAGGALIAGGLLSAVMDGFEGLKSAKDWGVSDLSGFIGGFLSGKESGWKGALGNAGKWGATGAGVGLMFGPVGMIVGGLLGAAVGAILGFIGGEEIAKMFDGLLQDLGLQKKKEVTPEEKKNLQKFKSLERQGTSMDIFDSDEGRKITGDAGFFGDTSQKGINKRKEALAKLAEADKSRKVESLNSSLLLPKKNWFGNYEGEELQRVANNIVSDPTLVEKLGITDPNFLKGGAEGVKTYLVEKYLKEHKDVKGTNGLAELLYSSASGSKELLDGLKGIQDGKQAKAYFDSLSNPASAVQVRDAIITKTGQVIHTDPQDNLYAFKKLPDLGGASDGKMSRSLGETTRATKLKEFEDNKTDRLIDALAKSGKGSNVNQINNYADRFSQANLLDSLTMEVS